MNSELFEELGKSIKEAGRVRRGKADAARAFSYNAVDIRRLRKAVKVSQSTFAGMIGVSPAAVKNWEQGRRKPRGPAMALLRLFEENPRFVVGALGEARTRDLGTTLVGPGADTVDTRVVDLSHCDEQITAPDHRANDSGKEFVVVFRATSAPMFSPGSFLRVYSQIKHATVVLTFQTRHTDVGLDRPFPGDLWVDARGPASSLEEAVRLSASIAGEVVAAIAFGTNGAISDLEPELAFDNSPGISRRVFLQSVLPGEKVTMPIRRIVNVQMISRLLEAIQRHGEKGRILRSISQYNLALRYWRSGLETLATEHLFMGAEALTKAIARYRQVKSGLSDASFAKELGIDPGQLRHSKELQAAILSKVRSDLVFRGDHECHRHAKQASDAFEHGFLPFDKIYESAVRARDKSASYLRESIIELLDLDQDARSFYNDKSKNRPLGYWPVVKYVKGQLVGESMNLASEGNAYPVLSCKSQLNSISRTKTGEYVLSVNEKMTPRLGSEIKFQPQSFEVWRP